MYMHYKPFFSANSAVTVIMSSEHYIWKYMIWSSSGIIFQCEFSCKGDYVIQALYIWKIWYGHHQASFFSANSTVRVIMSSGHCIWENMIWSSSGIIFQCEFNCKGDYVIQALYIWKKYDMVIIKHHFSVRIQL